MKAPAFAYVRAESLGHVHELLARYGSDAKLLAGGQSLMPLLNMRLAAPAVLIDLNGLVSLANVQACSDRIVLGALVRHAELERSELVERELPLLAQALPHLAHPAIRARGTIGGSIAFADPAAELPACCLALNATLVLASPSGERRVRSDSFFLDLYETVLTPHEVLVRAELDPAGPGEHFAFTEIARRHGDYATVGLALKARISGGSMTELRLAFFGTDRTPKLARAAAGCLTERVLDSDTLAAAKRALEHDLDPVADIYHSVQTKRQLAGVVLERTLRQLPLTRQ